MKPHPQKHPAKDPERLRLEAMTDTELRDLSIQTGRLGARAFQVWSERSLSKRDGQNFSLK